MIEIFKYSLLLSNCNVFIFVSQIGAGFTPDTSNINFHVLINKCVWGVLAGSPSYLTII